MSVQFEKLEEIRTKIPQNTLHPFVIDFCEFWLTIHKIVEQQKVHKISKTIEIVQSLKFTHTIPFYEKYCPIIDDELDYLLFFYTNFGKR